MLATNRIKGRSISYQYALFATLLLLLTSLVVGVYYVNHPAPEPLADTWSYLYVVDRIQMHGQLINFWRLPGYPLFIVLVYTFVDQGNLGAVSIAQAILFVLATLEIYVLCALVLRRAWIAFLISLLVGMNVSLLSYVKPIMSEALALWLLASLVLACVYFLSTLQMRRFWLVTACMLLLFLTRPEWIFLPVPLFAYLLLVAWWRGKGRKLLPHVLASLVLLYALLGGYIYVNATQNDFAGVTWIENINALGKVLQYNMQNEALLQYAGVSKILDKYVAEGIQDPYVIMAREPSLVRDDAALSGTFARSVIEHHPVEFLVKSVPIFFSSLTVYSEESSITPHTHFARYLTWLDAAFRALYKWYIFFPACALLWLLLLCWQRTRRLRMVQMIGAVVLLALYGLIATALGAYRDIDYTRIHVTFNPLLIVIIWGTLLEGALRFVQRGPNGLLWLAGHSFLGRRLNLAQASMYRVLLLPLIAFLLIAIAAAYGLRRQVPQGSADAVPILCHREPGVGLLFITIENRGNNAGPSTTTLEFNTASSTLQSNSAKSRVRLEVKTPSIPAGTEVWVAAELPSTRRAGFVQPAGKITITTASSTQRAGNTLVTSCNDHI